MTDTTMRLEFEQYIRDSIVSECGEKSALMTDEYGNYFTPWVAHRWTGYQAATERATAQQDVNRLDFLSKQVYRWHTGDGGYSARLKFRWEDSIIETSLRDAIDAAIRIAGDGIHTCTPPKDKP